MLISIRFLGNVARVEYSQKDNARDRNDRVVIVKHLKG